MGPRSAAQRGTNKTSAWRRPLCACACAGDNNNNNNATTSYCEPKHLAQAKFEALQARIQARQDAVKRSVELGEVQVRALQGTIGMCSSHASPGIAPHSLSHMVPATRTRTTCAPRARRTSSLRSIPPTTSGTATGLRAPSSRAGRTSG